MTTPAPTLAPSPASTEAVDDPSLVRRWRRLPPLTRGVLGFAALVIFLNGALRLVTQLSGGADPGGPRSSSYSTGADGLAAYADLLLHYDHPVSRLRRQIADSGVDAGGTLVVVDTFSLLPEDMESLESFVGRGGRLVITGPAASGLLVRLLGPGGAPTTSPAGRDDEDDDASGNEARPVGDEPEVAAIDEIDIPPDPVTWHDAGDTEPLLAVDGDPDRLLAVAADVGEGRIIGLTEPDLLQNQFLARSDNAAFGLALAGEDDRRVVFAEAAHGFAAVGLDAIPVRWRWAGAFGGLAVLWWMWSRGKRFGPPDQVEPDLVPPRRRYVDSLAALLTKTKQPAGAAEPLRRHAIDALFARAGWHGGRRVGTERPGRRNTPSGPALPESDAAAAEAVAIQQAGVVLGLQPHEIDTLLRPAADDDAVLALGRVAARIGGTKQ